jgi:hypothetical protein
MREYLSADEAKKIAMEGSLSLDRFFDEVKSRVLENHVTEFNYFIDPPLVPDFTDTEIEFIRGKGYKIYWNRACGWYEVRL